jgi:rhamnogalacturonan endolyase
MVKHPHAISAAVLLMASLLAFAADPQAKGNPTDQDSTSGAGGAVVITDSGDTVTLENGVVSVKIAKVNADILSLRYKALSLVSSGKAYWNVLGSTPGGVKTEKRGTPSILTVTQDPARNGGEMGEIELLFPYKKGTDAEPLDIAIRYTLRRGDSGVYGWTILNHSPDYPAFDIEISTVALKLNPQIFDHLTVDSRRNQQMITGSDWIHGQPLNLKEARRMTTGIRAGQVEHKYDYSAMFSETPAYGWSSTTQNVGLWIVNPSLEYINGAPTKIELTGHIDLKDVLPADPTLLFVWHGSHYGGMPISIDAGEQWNKVVGPFLIYCNSGPNPDAMWQDALARAVDEQQAWPYDWAKAPGYASAAERGAVRGRLVVDDPQQAGASAANAWVGLAAAPYPAVDEEKKPFTVGWETDGKHYEYWTHADKTGAFTIRNARPGNYVLYAFNDGILGEFSRADVAVESAQTRDLGTLTWTPVRYGRQVWEIGIPNRSAEEFRHGDHYWEWGLYNLYPQEFPNDVNFIIGRSDWARDWNYAQPPRVDDKGVWHGTTWRITFDQAKVTPGKATLRMALCGTRDSQIDVAVNGHAIGTTGALPSSGVMHRDGIRGTEIECDLPFDTSLLVAGKNVMELTTHARYWYDGVLYDYLRLEIDDGASQSPR